MCNNPKCHNHVNKSIEWLTRDNHKLALHQWIPKNPQAVVFYIHGIQSHAGWVTDLGKFLAHQNIALFVMDRRGSGESEGMRGDIPSTYQLLEDYYQALLKVKSQFPSLPLTLFGQSFGGSILAALLSKPNFDIHYDGVVFCASALGKRRYQLSFEERFSILRNRSAEYTSLGLRDEDYTDDPHFLHFMKSDKKCFREITYRGRAASVELENRYCSKFGVISHANPVYLCPQKDPLVDLPQALNIFMQLSGNQGIKVQFPVEKHYLLFSAFRTQVMQWLTQYALSAGYRQKKHAA